ncbi:uncharacterized protein LOC114944329 [Nylanderia fulva]|uniref:uncharacterized protein LOC114944329 n=1 Tax=Nylanderia fulva TaxID=613905 RepID=UPI0010FAF641|nr:uncharacterized protein LOC114944329 [Nylanderia fulva]
MVGGTSWEDATARTNIAINRVVRYVRRMGLKVAPQKTEAIFLHDGSHGAPPRVHITVEDTPIEVGACMKYLSLHLDNKWTFQEHFRRISPKVKRAAMALQRLLPNLGGPGGSVRKLYAGTVHAMLLYGAPVWSKCLGAARGPRDALRQVQKRVANRICRGYRTVSWAATGVLSGVPPVEMLARMYAEVYTRTRGYQRAGITMTESLRRTVRVHSRRALIQSWKEFLADPTLPGQRTVGAIRPCLENWLDRAKGGVSYHMTQVLTGHGCFGEYLHRIGKERTTRCHHCGHERDTAQHTLAECVAWAGERERLVAAVGRDLSLPSVVRAMTDNEDAWRTFSSFCGEVMLQKEEAERERERMGEEREEEGGDVPPLSPASAGPLVCGAGDRRGGAPGGRGRKGGRRRRNQTDGGCASFPSSAVGGSARRGWWGPGGVRPPKEERTHGRRGRALSFRAADGLARL